MALLIEATNTTHPNMSDDEFLPPPINANELLARSWPARYKPGEKRPPPPPKEEKVYMEVVESVKSLTTVDPKKQKRLQKSLQKPTTLTAQSGLKVVENPTDQEAQNSAIAAELERIRVEQMLKRGELSLGGTQPKEPQIPPSRVNRPGPASAPVSVLIEPYRKTPSLAEYTSMHQTIQTPPLPTEADVETALKTSVVMATDVFRMWNDVYRVGPTDTLDERNEEARKWCSPETFSTRFLELFTGSNIGAVYNVVNNSILSFTKAKDLFGLEQLNVSGRNTFNDIFAFSSEPKEWKDMTDEQKYHYPPQFDHIKNMAKSQEGSKGEVIIRITRLNQSSAFHQESKVVREIFSALDASLRGFGPKVYAACSFRVLRRRSEPSTNPLTGQPTNFEPVWGSIIVMDRYKEDLTRMKFNVWKGTSLPATVAQRIQSNALELPDLVINGDAVKIQKRIEALAVASCDLCFKIAAAGKVNFDMKPANVLLGDIVDGEFDTNVKVKLIDFDSHLYKGATQPVATWQAAMLANLLLLHTHVRAVQFPWISNYFSAAVRDTMIELAQHVHTTQDPLDGWMFRARHADWSEPFASTFTTGHPLSISDEPLSMLWTWKHVVDFYFFNTPAKSNTEEHLYKLRGMVVNRIPYDFEAELASVAGADDSNMRTLFKEMMRRVESVARLKPGVHKLDKYNDEVTAYLFSRIHFVSRPPFAVNVVPINTNPNMPGRLWWSGEAQQPSQVHELMRFIIFYNNHPGFKGKTVPVLKPEFALMQTLLNFKI